MVTRARASPQASQQTCKVCRLPPSEAGLVEGASRSGLSPRSVAARFKTLSRKDVSAHMVLCVKKEEKEEVWEE